MLRRITSNALEPDHFAWLRSMFSRAYFENLVRHYFLPHRPVQLGDTWPVHHEYPAGIVRMLQRPLVRDLTVTLQRWELRGQRLCARLELQGTEKTKSETNSDAAKMFTPSTDGTYSGVAWFDPELGRVLEMTSSRDFKVTSNKPVGLFANPAVAGPTQAITDHHHQVITEKLFHRLLL